MTIYGDGVIGRDSCRTEERKRERERYLSARPTKCLVEALLHIDLKRYSRLILHVIFEESTHFHCSQVNSHLLERESSLNSKIYGFGSVSSFHQLCYQTWLSMTKTQDLFEWLKRFRALEPGYFGFTENKENVFFGAEKDTKNIGDYLPPKNVWINNN